MKIKHLLCATFFCLLSGLVFAEDCGTPVYTQNAAATWFDATFNKGEHAEAAAKWYACYQRNLLPAIDSPRAIESCKQAIRRITALPSTLSFAEAYFPPEHTEGGYMVRVGGKSADGSFFMHCYMDKNFNVTAVR